MHWRHTLTTWVVCVLLTCSCSQAVKTPDTVADAQAEAEAVQTAISVAVEATLTMIASLPMALPTATPAPPSGPTPTGAPEAIPTVPPPTLVPTVELGGCTPDSHFESDVTIPDNKKITCNTEFTKTWEITNNGTCDWETSFFLKHVDGDGLSDVDSVPVPPAKAGETVQVSVRMKAPEQPGTYVSKWRVCASPSQCFGAVLYAKIIAVAP